MPKRQSGDTNSRMVLFPLSMLGHKHILKVQKRSFTKERYATTCQWLGQLIPRPKTIVQKSLFDDYLSDYVRWLIVQEQSRYVTTIHWQCQLIQCPKTIFCKGSFVRRLDQWTMSVDQSSHDDPLQNLRFDTIYHPCYSLRIILRAPRGQHVMGT